MKPGLVSITFRSLSVESIIELMCKAGSVGIEWGGDIHVPHGNIALAKRVGEKTRAAGLEVAAYGSYYRVGESEAAGLPFTQVLATAKALGAPLIRVWAGNKGAQLSNENDRAKVVIDSKRIASLAAREEIEIAYEYHINTLTDSDQSTRQLLKEVGNISTLWQPTCHYSTEECLKSIEGIRANLKNIHVYHWVAGQRKALSEGRARWELFLNRLSVQNEERYALIEFVQNNCPENFIRDTNTLKGWIQRAEDAYVS